MLRPLEGGGLLIRGLHWNHCPNTKTALTFSSGFLGLTYLEGREDLVSRLVRERTIGGTIWVIGIREIRLLGKSTWL